MNSKKCKNCGLANFSDDLECRRCGQFFVVTSKPKSRSPISIWSLLFIAFVAGLFYYFYHGIEQSIEEVSTSEARRLAAQPAVKPEQQGLSRSQADQQRSGTFANNIRESQSLADHNKHIRDTEKAAQDASSGK